MDLDKIYEWRRRTPQYSGREMRLALAAAAVARISGLIVGPGIFARVARLFTYVYVCARERVYW